MFALFAPLLESQGRGWAPTLRSRHMALLLDKLGSGFGSVAGFWMREVVVGFGRGSAQLAAWICVGLCMDCLEAEEISLQCLGCAHHFACSCTTGALFNGCGCTCCSPRLITQSHFCALFDSVFCVVY